MKKSILVLLLFSSISSFSQNKLKIKGDKNVIQTTVDLPDFNALEVRDDLEITFSTNNYNSTFSITADSNLHETIKFEVIDSVLIIYSNAKISSKKKLEITLNAKKINKINLFDDCKLKQVGILETENFELESNANAKIKLDVKAKNITAILNNNTSSEFFFQADSTRMVLSDEIDVKGFIKSTFFDVSMYNDAEATLDGYADEARLAMTGKPSLKAEKMVLRSAKIRLSNTSAAEVNSSGELKLFLEDKSKIYIYSAPNIIIDGLRDNAEIIKR